MDLNICQKFKDCCDVVVESTLKGALHSLNEWELLSHSYTKANSPLQVNLFLKIKSHIRLFIICNIFFTFWYKYFSGWYLERYWEFGINDKDATGKKQRFICKLYSDFTCFLFSSYKWRLILWFAWMHSLNDLLTNWLMF